VRRLAGSVASICAVSSTDRARSDVKSEHTSPTHERNSRTCFAAAPHAEACSGMTSIGDASPSRVEAADRTPYCSRRGARRPRDCLSIEVPGPPGRQASAGILQDTRHKLFQCALQPVGPLLLVLLCSRASCRRTIPAPIGLRDRHPLSGRFLLSLENCVRIPSSPADRSSSCVRVRSPTIREWCC